MRTWMGGKSLVSALVVLTLGSMGCHEPNQTRRVLASGVLDTSALDFGEVPVGEWRSARVKVRNVGYVPFNALEVLKLEDNPSYVVEIDDGRVMPGQERDVLVKFHPLAEGDINDSIHVATDADDKPQDKVTLHGIGTPTPVKVEPSDIDFETLEVDSDRIMEVLVTNPVDLPLTVRLTGDDTTPFDSDVVTIPPFASQRVNLRYFPKSKGENAAKLEVRSCENCTPTATAMKGKAVPYAFEFDPAPVPFQNVPVHESTRSKTVMKNITWRPVSVTNTRTSDDSFKSITDVSGQQFAPGESREVELEFAARFSGPDVGEWRVNYSSDKARMAPLPLDARGGRPTLAITPITIDFGEVPVGAKAEQVVVMTNAGTQGAINFLGIRGQGNDVSEFNVSAPFRGPAKTPTETWPWAAGSTWPDLNTAQPVAIQPGADSLQIKAFFAPD
ncbi:MAG: choice-of-anchor D domain-containing protein, partial [Myxococcaceae bacterium]